jgi:hypothetical protein
VPRPLPGIRFETIAPPPADVLPRMDVAVFVGLAASGPIEVPVAVEDPVSFGEVFGDLPTGNLGPAVRAFFRNGGRRCWIVRVAAGAAASRFPIPGLSRVAANGAVTPAFAVARSEGSWSNLLNISSALQVETLQLVSASLHEVQIAITSGDPVAPGDLLRLGSSLLVFAERVKISGNVAIVTTGHPHGGASPPPALTRVERLTFELRGGGLRIDGLGFSPAHPRYWAALPSDADLYAMDSPSGLALDALHPRFPIAGMAQSAPALFLPLDMPTLPSEPAVAVAAGSDGVAEFDDHLFLDSRLADTRALDLVAEADYIRYQSPTPDSLHGVHAALGIDEATIIAVPDAVLAGWKSQTTRRTLPAPPVSSPPAAPPVPLFWKCDSPPALAAVASSPALGAAIEIDVTTSSFTADPLLRIHQALLRMCAARGDLFAVLSVPQEFRETDLLAHAARIAAADPAVLSYGAVYHPWLTGREEDAIEQLRTSPPDGAAAGTMAKRSFLRGAWIAPAGEKLRGVVALSPPMRPEYWQSLQDAQLNIIRQEPSGFLCLNADTLSQDDDLRPINVRRLLQLLRRAALKLGTDYVFEPNDAAFQRSVQRGFEKLLDGMFLRGAFAGRVASQGFQVVTEASLNTPASIEQGRFIVDLKVAPSLPLTFLTVRLVQAADRTFVTEGA